MQERSVTAAKAFTEVIGTEDSCLYTCKKLLGSGSYGVVWLLQRKTDNALFVGKIMDTNTMNEKDKKFAMSEVGCLQMCDSPHIISFVDLIEREGLILLLLEYADAGDLQRQVSARGLKGTYLLESEVYIIFTQLALALHHMHQKKMMHRDIKTSNVMLTSSGLVKLGDFGFSRVYDESPSMNVGSTFCGTPYYLAPELWNKEKYSKKADVWSLGVVLYEMMALKQPFPCPEMRELIDQVVKGAYVPLSPDRYSADLRAVCELMLKVNPNDRPTIAEILSLPQMQTHGLKVLQASVPRLVTLAPDAREKVMKSIEDGLTISHEEKE